MSEPSQSKMEFHVVSTRLSAQASESRCKQALIALDTDLAGNPRAFNPAELLLAALSACMIKGIERVLPILKFELRGFEVTVHGVRQDLPQRLESIRNEIIVDSDEPQRPLDLLHENAKKYGMVFNTVVPGTDLGGVLRRKEASV